MTLLNTLYRAYGRETLPFAYDADYDDGLAELPVAAVHLKATTEYANLTPLSWTEWRQQEESAARFYEYCCAQKSFGVPDRVEDFAADSTYFWPDM